MTRLERTKVLHYKRGQTPRFASDGKGGKRTTATPVYVRRQPGKAITVSTKPGPWNVTSLTNDELAAVRRTADRFEWELIERRADIVLKPANRWPNLDGDLDCDADLLDRLDRVAEDLNVTILVRSGKRTIDEQWALYNLLGPSIAAYPSLNAPHVRGVAADCGVNGRDIGEWPGARAAMKRHGLCLRVPGEDWHVEVGIRWAA